ncbi:Abi family protein [Streptococcus equi subsp. zooepidemicus]|uniref:Abi family protein n=1 Tax=Streptococcus equi TaxID=1336 RepID=UPI001E58782B|nr:Abi family protein [Streptococcus equi]MCD3433163.1 Abi family protein [Streptococcus equi subsp. zooepidemicus]HEK9993573.1 Abi family protein [Streptococcus equi subsp. zooepidemicus]HEL0000894.1 Abi family protein [Streptococcus equi subsp. zooepidemicus]
MKLFSDFKEQIRILKEDKKITINDMNNTEFALKNYGYYEIVNGYKVFLLNQNSETEEFRQGETFEHLASLYNLDKEIRNHVMQATQEIESTLKTALSYTIAKDFGIDEKDYLDRRKYNSGDFSKKYGCYQRDYLLDMLKEIATNRKVEPLISYRIKHGHIPPWILLKEATFGNLVNLFKVLKGPQKNKVISHCIGLDTNLPTNADKKLFSEMLDLVLAFRNRAAHGGRMFNYKAKRSSSLSYHKKFHTQIGITPADYRHGKGRNDIYSFFYSMAIFDNKNGYNRLEACLYHIIEHDAEYPDDWRILANEMGYPEDKLQKELEIRKNFVNLLSKHKRF